MIEYRPVETDANVNVSNSSPLKEFATLLGGLIAIIVVIYMGLGFAVDIVAGNISVESEKSMLGFMSKAFNTEAGEESEEITAMQKRIERVYDLLPSSFMKELPDYDYKLIVYDNNNINAVALPGGNILIFRGLLKELSSDRQLLFVIGHELGHFANHDHLSGLGRKLVLSLMSVLIAGPDSGLTRIFSSIENTLTARHSQRQEFSADDWGLKAYKAAYGSGEGAADFMRILEKMSKGGSMERWSYFLASHPHAKDRIKRIEKMSK